MTAITPNTPIKTSITKIPLIFFLISGYFLARSIEKISAKEKYNPALESCRFMGNKVKGILPTHLTAIIAVIIVILACDLANSGQLLLNGLPSIFLVQMGGVWTEAYASALIVPEWYLSAMLLSMLFIVPIALLLRKKNSTASAPFSKKFTLSPKNVICI